MKTHLAFAVTMLAASLTAQAGPGIWTTHVPVNDSILNGAFRHRALYRTDDSHYADPRWHRVPGALFTIRRTYMVPSEINPHLLSERRTISSAWKFPAERDPLYVWSRASFTYVPYPVDYSSLIPEPEREHVGYTTIERTEPAPLRERPPFLHPAPVRQVLPPIATGPVPEPLPPIGAATAQ